MIDEKGKEVKNFLVEEVRKINNLNDRPGQPVQIESIEDSN